MATYQLVTAESSDPGCLLGLWVERGPDLDIGFPARAAAHQQVAEENTAETRLGASISPWIAAGEGAARAGGAGRLHAAERALDGVPGRVQAVLDEPHRTSFAATGADCSTGRIRTPSSPIGSSAPRKRRTRSTGTSSAGTRGAGGGSRQRTRSSITSSGCAVRHRRWRRWSRHGSSRALASSSREDVDQCLAAGHGSRHAEAVGVAVSSRLTLLRALALAVRSAAIIGASLILSGGPVLAIPAAWRFVHQVALLGAGREGPRHDRPTS